MRPVQLVIELYGFSALRKSFYLNVNKSKFHKIKKDLLATARWLRITHAKGFMHEKYFMHVIYFFLAYKYEISMHEHFISCVKMVLPCIKMKKIAP